MSSGRNKGAKMVPGGILGGPGEHLGDLGDLSGVWLILESIFRGNVPKVTESCSKNSFSEFTRGNRGNEPIPGNGTNRAVPDLCSTRAWGKDDGS